MRENSLYHRALRIAAVVTTLVLVFQSGIVHEHTALVATGTQSYLANAIGVSAGVPPTELNEYTAALTAKERELAAREAALTSREITVARQQQGDVTTNDRTTYVLAAILFLLLVLIVLNYTLDFLRQRDQLQTRATPV